MPFKKDKIASHIKIAIVIPEEPPQEYVAKWHNSMKKAAPRMGQTIKKSVTGVGDYVQKIVKPGIKKMINLLNPEFSSKKDRNFKEIMEKAIKDMPKGFGKYKAKMKRVYGMTKGKKAKSFIETIELLSYWVASRNSKLILPFTGYKDVIRGAGPFAARWLTGDLPRSPKKPKLKPLSELITRDDITIKPNPILITKTNQLGIFRNKFNSRIRQAGAMILKNRYDADEIYYENQITNKLVHTFVDPGLGLEAFTTGGASHVDFIKENKQLFLEIQVSAV